MLPNESDTASVLATKLPRLKVLQQLVLAADQKAAASGVTAQSNAATYNAIISQAIKDGMPDAMAGRVPRLLQGGR